jgi:uncharacterized protein (TIGR00369 family)
MTDPKVLAGANAFLSALPHAAALGMRIEAFGAGTAKVAMAYDLRFVGDPSTGVMHGGAVSALMDTACAAAVLAHPDTPRSTATIDLRIEYMRAATPGQTIVALAECHHMTRTVAFVRATAFDDDGARPVATATAAFTVEKST